MEPTEPTGRVLAGTDLSSTPDRPGPVGRPDATDRDRLVTLAEAASLSGLSSEAIRLRIRRKSLWSTRRNDGRTVVRARDLIDLPPARPVASDRSSMDDQPGLSRLLDRIETLEGTLETERQERTAERVEVAGRLATAEAERDAERRRADTADAARERAEAALHEARLPWHDRLARVVQAFRRG